MKVKKQTISLKIIVAAVLCIGILLTSILHMYQAYQGMKAGILSATQTTARHMVDAVSQTVKATLLPSSVTLHLLRYDRIASASSFEERLQSLKLLSEALNANPIANSVYIGYSNGDFFMLRRFFDRYPLLSAPAPTGSYYILQSITQQKDGSVLKEQRFYDKSLSLLELRKLEHYDFNPRLRLWYQEAMKTDELTITPPYIFFSTGDIGITLAARNIQGNAVVGLDATAGDLAILLSKLALTPNSEIAIVDQDGIVVAYPDINKLFVKDGEHFRLPRLPELEIRALEKLSAPDFPRNALENFSSEKADWYGFVSRVEGFSHQYKILIAIPGAELLADAWDNLIQEGFVSAAVLAALLLTGWYIGTRLVHPLRQLTEQVSALAAFKFDTSIGVNTRVSEVRELGSVLGNMARTIDGFQALSLSLNREKDLALMLSSVLDRLLYILQVDSGAIYLYNESEKKLCAYVWQKERPLEEITLTSSEMSDEELLSEIQRQVGGDDILAVLRNRTQALVGVLYIQCQGSDAKELHRTLTPFVNRIAGSAAVAIETRQLLLAQKALLDSIISLIASAIDTKSRYTGGHCRRVPVLAEMIMDTVLASKSAPFAGYVMSSKQQEEFRLAAWLHDCGKITTPEYVVDKAVKLETIWNRIHEIRTRFEILHRDTLLAYFGAIQNGTDPNIAQETCQKELAQLQDDFTFVALCNKGTEEMSPEALERLKSIAERTWLRHFDDRLGLSRDELSRIESDQVANPSTLPALEKLIADKPIHIVPWKEGIPSVMKNDSQNIWGFDMLAPSNMYNYGELYNLSIKRGTLTEEERFKINDHIIQTIRMLSALPFPKGLENIPSIAGNHHERMDGKGYPRKLHGEQMSIPERVMAIADVFEALTASDRPYKEAKKLSESFRIMSRMAQEGHIDKDIFNLFLSSKAYLSYAERYLKPEQIDNVIVEHFSISDQ